MFSVEKPRMSFRYQMKQTYAEKRRRITEVKRPCDVPEEGLVCDLLWSDPEPDITGSPRFRRPPDRALDLCRLAASS